MTKDGSDRSVSEGDDARVSRRQVLQAGAGLPALAAVGALAEIGRRPEISKHPLPSRRRQGPRVVVVGAGAFGGWTALHLQRAGARVTLVDSWGPGNSRASSGGETRVIRGTYGPDRIYVEMVVRALQLWRENEQRWGRDLYRRTGVLWMVGEFDEYERAALTLLRAAGLEYEELTADQLAARFPLMNPEGIRWAIYEHEAGYLHAWRACVAVLEGFLAEGGEYRQATVRPGALSSGEMRGVALSDGSRVQADAYVFACGAWLGRVFPDLLGNLIRPTRQEVYYFGTPAGDSRYLEGSFPIWIDNGDNLYYGIPGDMHRGFKVADDTRRSLMDPSQEERTPTPERLQAARQYMAFRFPGMVDAPLLQSRVCAYENTPDQDFILDRHPEAANVWILGGGSGHGYKHGPAIGERAAAAVLGDREPDDRFRLSRLLS